MQQASPVFPTLDFVQRKRDVASSLTIKTAAAAAQTAASGSRPLPMFNAMRFLAGAGVIWFHSIESSTLAASGTLGRLSVSLFTIMGVVVIFESLRKHPQRTLGEFAQKRFRRLYLPFLGWSAMIGAVLVALHEMIPAIQPARLNLDVLISGTAEPLWFIPFFIIGSVLAFPLVQWMVKNPRSEWLIAGICAAIALTLDWTPWNTPPLGHVPLLGKLLELSWNRWSAFFWGIALAVVFTRILRHSRWTGLIAIAGLLTAIATVAYQWHHGIVPGLKVAGGIGLTLLAVAPARGKLIQRLESLAPLSFGMYLCHALWILLARTLLEKLGTPISWQKDVIVFLSALLASILSLKLLSRVPTLSWLAGMDAAAEKPAPRPPHVMLRGTT